jgi:hypothetical protein
MLIFNGAEAVEVSIASLVDHSHPALTELFHNAIVGVRLSDHDQTYRAFPSFKKDFI